jgi:NodT family efflux transporter outer membrane factor (OMF) lipoprotein
VRKRLTARLALALALVAVASPAAAQDQPAFWQRLGDTTLVRLTGEALEANQDVQVAVSRVRQARAARLNAQLDLAPAITVAGGYTRLRISDATFGVPQSDQDLWDAGLQASWELDVFGRLRKNLRGQNALNQSAEQDVRDVGRAIAAELATAYYELRGAQAQLEVARRNAENQRGTLAITQERLQAGRGSALDTERAQAQLSTTLGFIPVFESRVTAAQYRIGVLVGRDPRTVVPELTGSVILPELPEQAVLGDPDSLIRNRPDVRSAERRLAAETAFVGAAKADYLPRLTVGGTAGYTATTFDSLGESGTGRYAVGPVLSWPALNLGRVKAGVDQAQALESEARARYQRTVLLAREEMATSLVAYARARERLIQLEEAAGASERAAGIARLRYEGGVADFLQVLDAQRTLLVAQDQLELGRTDAVTALVAVYRAHGG